MFSFATIARSISFGCKTKFLKGALSLVQGGASYTRFLMPAIYSHRLKRSLNLRNLCMSLVHQEYEQKMKGIHPDFFSHWGGSKFRMEGAVQNECIIYLLIKYLIHGLYNIFTFRQVESFRWPIYARLYITVCTVCGHILIMSTGRLAGH